MKKVLKSIISIAMIITIITSCNALSVRNTSLRSYSTEDPQKRTPPMNTGLEFVELHNDVLTSIMGQYTPFFFVVENGFVISGTNDPKVIKIELTCLEGTTKADVDLVLSMALNYIGIFASEQLFKYKAPQLGDDNTYLDFGTVFNDYDLSVKVVDVKDKTIEEFYTKAGNKIPIDPRYIMED